MATPTETLALAKELGIIVPGKAFTYREIAQAVREAEEPDHIEDEDGEQAFMRYAEGGWHGGARADEPWWAQ